MLNLFHPWVNKQQRIFSADIYFSLVQTCDKPKKHALRFIGVVNTSSRGFCMEKLPEIYLARIGMCKGYFSTDNKKTWDKYSILWVDRNRRYFISNTSYLKPGMTYARDRIIQVDDSPNVDPVYFEFEINQTRVKERYYSIN